MIFFKICHSTFNVCTLSLYHILIHNYPALLVLLFSTIYFLLLLQLEPTTMYTILVQSSTLKIKTPINMTRHLCMYMHLIYIEMSIIAACTSSFGTLNLWSNLVIWSPMKFVDFSFRHLNLSILVFFDSKENYICILFRLIVGCLCCHAQNSYCRRLQSFLVQVRATYVR